MSQFLQIKPQVTKYDVRPGAPMPKYVTYRCFKKYPDLGLNQPAWKVIYANGESAKFYNGGLYQKFDRNGKLVFCLQ